MKKRLILVFLILLAGFVYAQDCYDIKEPIAIPSDTVAHSYAPFIVAKGNEYDISWYDNRSGNNEIYFARLDANGNKIGSDIRLTNNIGGSGFPSFVVDANGYGIIWRDDRDGNDEIYFAKLDANGNKVGSDVRITSNTASSVIPVITWTYNIRPFNYGVAWTDYRDANYEIYFTRVDANGNKIGSDVRITNNNQQSSSPKLVWNGNGYGLIWHDNEYGNFNIHFVKLDAGGNKISNVIRLSSTESGTSVVPYIVWTGTEYGAVWYNLASSQNIYFARIHSNGSKIGNSLKLTNNELSARYPFILWNGSEYDVTWYDNRDGNEDIYFTRINSNGNKIDTNNDGIVNASDDIRITNSGVGGSWMFPTLAYNGNGYGLSWSRFINHYTAYFTTFNQIPCPVVECSPNGITQQCGITDAGECSYGTQTCVSGAWDSCVGDVGPATETCDNLDNDCNNLVDDIQDLNSLQDGVCASSTMKCIDGVASDDYSTINDYESTEATCDDALDNDCDGLSDADDSDCIAIDCSECSGITCSSIDCHTIGDCYFVSGLIGGDCFNTIDATSCSDFGNDDLACNNNAVHGLGCSYNSVDEICEESGILCGNGNIDIDPITGTENCLSCQEDAGCGLDPSKPYCQPTGSCGASADPTLADDNDWVCEAGETCGGNDCAGEQAGCANGYICDNVNIGGGCVDGGVIDPSQMNCADLGGVDCPSTDSYNEPQYCISIWNGGLPYIQTIQTLDTNNCCLTGQCGATDTGTGVTGQVRLLSRGNCIPIGEGVEGSMQVTTTVYDENGQVIGTPTTTQETCYISKKIQLPFYNFISIFMTLVILIGFYLRFSKKH